MTAVDSAAKASLEFPQAGVPRDDSPSPSGWPRLLGCLGCMLCGGALASYAYKLATTNQGAGRALIALALLIIVGAFVTALTDHAISASQGLVVSITLCTVLFLFKLGREPSEFVFTDELQHVRSTAELLGGARPFVRNPINPVLAHFPGLHLVTAELGRITGLSLFAAGNLIVFVARLLLTAALFALYRSLLRSSRLAVLAVALYAANPAYLYFDAQFSYESLALPLAAAALSLVLGGDKSGRARPLEWLVTLVLIGSTIVTHHITSYLMALLFFFFGLAFSREDWPTAKASILWGMIAAAGAAAWTAFVAPDAWHYLTPDISSVLKSIPDFLSGHGHARAPFAASPVSTPLWERSAGLLSVLLDFATLVAGAHILRRAKQLSGPLGWCVLLGVAYFATLPLQLLQSSTAAPIAPRLWETTFIALAPVSALGLARLWRSLRGGGRTRIARFGATGICAASLFLMLLGGATIRSGTNIRLPGPYLPSSGPLAATPDTITAARWLLATYGPERLVMGDFTLSSVFGAYALAAPETYQNYGVRPWRLFFTPTITPAGLYELDQSGTQFVLLDQRITKYKPFNGFYFSAAEPRQDFSLVPQPDLRKFAHNPAFKRVYDSGNILIYRYLPHR